MAIDFLISCLLLISFLINLLALGVFCMTPTLRTTPNRFVINLLTINLAGCFILASTLLLLGSMSATVHTHSHSYNLNNISKDITKDLHRLTLQRKRMRQEQEVLYKFKQSENIFKHSSEYIEKLTIKEKGKHGHHEKMHKKMAVDPMAKANVDIIEVKSTQFMRIWSIDLAAALGALSVLVVVGDTWMAVRDPLRYHSRVSEVKAWVLIALTWAFGIFFGVLSAYRQLEFECTIVIRKKRNSLSEQMQVLSHTTDTIFSMIFGYIYFLVIILLPFGFVCGMYWRIFSEAKENGMRMRKNMSSPLFRIANSLSRKQQHKKAILREKKNLSNIGLHRNSLLEEELMIAESHSALLPLSRLEETDEINPNKYLLNLSSIKGEINNNYSLKPFLKESPQDLIVSDRLQTIQHLYPTPYLQKYNHANYLTRFETTSNLRYMAYRTMQIRTTHISPKSISYTTSIRQRLSDASSIFKYREESRAARISILVVMMFLVSYLPYGFVVLLQGSQVINSFPYSTQLEVLMILLANLSSAFIFAYRNKRVRHGVTRLLGFGTHSRLHRRHYKCILPRFITKASTVAKRNSGKLSTYSINSCKYLTPVAAKHSRKSLQNTKYFMDTSSVGIYLTNSGSIQSSTMFGNIAVFNASVVDIQPEYTSKKTYRF